MIFMSEEKAEWTFQEERHKTPPDGLRLFLCGSEEYAGYDGCALVRCIRFSEIRLPRT